MKVKPFIFTVTCSVFSIIIYNEFLIYYITLFKCKWPHFPNQSSQNAPIRAIILADTHLLGPFRGHWADKLRREWQMHRSFQSAVTLFHPEAVFVLGDLFDEGHWVNRKQFMDYVLRFRQLFHVPSDVKIYGVAGNHDVGFHYSMHPVLVNRFDKAYNNTDNSLLSIRGNHFVFINSMSLEGDGCDLCTEAEEKLRTLGKQLDCAKGVGTCHNIKRIGEYSQPIIMQHFPTYRRSDRDCIEHDHVNASEQYRERWEVLSRDSTKLLGEMLKPRLVFGGHSHHYCRLVNSLGIQEYTISSFSWRNKNDPSFVLALFTASDYAISVCRMPLESTVFAIYIFGGLSLLLFSVFSLYISRKGKVHVN